MRKVTAQDLRILEEAKDLLDGTGMAPVDWLTFLFEIQNHFMRIGYMDGASKHYREQTSDRFSKLQQLFEVLRE